MKSETLPRISRILNIEPFKIQTLWNNSEIREIDFEPMFQTWQKSDNAVLLQLKDFNTFNKVSISAEHTLHWENVLLSFTFKGKTNQQPLDLDPDVLYEKSTLIRKVERILIGQLLKKTREELGITQVQVASNIGSTRHYISRIENDKSEIQIDTLQKIIELGLGKKMILNIQ